MVDLCIGVYGPPTNKSATKRITPKGKYPD